MVRADENISLAQSCDLAIDQKWSKRSRHGTDLDFCHRIDADDYILPDCPEGLGTDGVTCRPGREINRRLRDEDFRPTIGYFCQITAIAVVLAVLLLLSLIVRFIYSISISMACELCELCELFCKGLQRIELWMTKFHRFPHR